MYFSDVIFNLSTVGREQKEKINVLYSLVDEMIQQYKDEINNLNTTRNEEKRTHRTFFDIQMNACSKENFTRKEICDNIITMLITGSDSISTTINFVLFMLANFPEIQVCIYLFENN
ncbi:PREDICTED: aromatase 3-like [Wasmannia auropunctata]|uniref:aromatase 3-like n=1 Tax=Wasmannia auropunctata TaxID=64793 RepID=UPI0005F09688|nr:PREDICTED: aromatase 3-like [Wasmannia auropunctata]